MLTKNAERVLKIHASLERSYWLTELVDSAQITKLLNQEDNVLMSNATPEKWNWKMERAKIAHHIKKVLRTEWIAINLPALSFKGFWLMENVNHVMNTNMHSLMANSVDQTFVLLEKS